MRKVVFAAMVLILALTGQPKGQDTQVAASMYDIPPRWLVDLPTAGTLPRGYYTISFRVFNDGGAISSCDIGLSHRLQLGISYGADKVLSNDDPDWNPGLEFNLKFRIVDELEYFPAITVGYSSQGYGSYNYHFLRYTYKSRGFYAVVSRSFYFYQWTAGWHGGINYSRENEFDKDDNINFFLGFDATFQYNLALIAEYDVALNDDRANLPDGTLNEMGTSGNTFGGKGRGYFNIGIKWLFTENLELEAVLKDLFTNRRESTTFSREIRINYIDSF